MRFMLYWGAFSALCLLLLLSSGLNLRGTITAHLQQRTITEAAHEGTTPPWTSEVSSVHLQQGTTTEAAHEGTAPPRTPPAPRVLHVVFTSDVDPSRHPERLRAIRDSWGKDIWEDMIFVANGEGDEGRPVEDEKVRVMPAWAKSDTQKRLWMYREAGPFVLPETSSYQWVAFSNDNCMLLEANLRALLAPLKPSEPHFLGSELAQTPTGPHFNSASAIVLSRAALALLLRQCDGMAAQDALLPYDLQVAKCLRAQNVTPADTRDDEGGERFLMYNPVRSALGAYDDWFAGYKRNIGRGGAKSGLACCAKRPVAIHYVEAAEQRLLFSLLTEGRAEAKEARRARWQRAYDGIRGKLGAYSRAAGEGDDAAWELLLEKLEIAGRG